MYKHVAVGTGVDFGGAEDVAQLAADQFDNFNRAGNFAAYKVKLDTAVGVLVVAVQEDVVDAGTGGSGGYVSHSTEAARADSRAMFFMSLAFIYLGEFGTDCLISRRFPFRCPGNMAVERIFKRPVLRGISCVFARTIC